eukprot:496796-Pelagomonas_calceolata.AAC.16
MFLVLHLHAWQVGAGGLGAWIGSGSVQQDSWVVTAAGVSAARTGPQRRPHQCPAGGNGRRVVLTCALTSRREASQPLNRSNDMCAYPKVVLFVHGAEIVIKSVPSFLSAHPYSATSFKPYCV